MSPAYVVVRMQWMEDSRASDHYTCLGVHGHAPSSGSEYMTMDLSRLLSRAERRHRPTYAMLDPIMGPLSQRKPTA